VAFGVGYKTVFREVDLLRQQRHPGRSDENLLLGAGAQRMVVGGKGEGKGKGRGG